jgi:hypothetical protein
MGSKKQKSYSGKNELGSLKSAELKRGRTDKAANKIAKINAEKRRKQSKVRLRDKS